MDYMIVFRIGAIGIIVIVAHMILEQSNRKELAFSVSLVGLAVALGIVIPKIYDLFRNVETMFNHFQ